MPPKRGQAPQRTRTARNDDFSDPEFLANIRDAYGSDGWATTTAIAQQCGFTGTAEKGHTPARYVASRLSWMRDGQLLESMEPDHYTPYKEPGDRDTRWRLTAIGEAIVTGQLSRAAQTALERMDPGTMVLMMGELMRRGYVNGDVGEAFALRRIGQHHLAKRKLTLR